MTDQTPTDTPSSADRFLDLLLDALIERQRQRRAAAGRAVTADTGPASATAITQPAPTPPASHPRGAESAGARDTAPMAVSCPVAGESGEASGEVGPVTAPEPEGVSAVLQARPPIGMDRLLRRMLIGLLIAVVAINIPIAAHGVSLARILPDTAALVIRDGLVLKGSGDRIYMLQDDQLRWISSLEAFEHLGLTWEDVHEVDDAFLSRFETGRPIDILLKCDGSPHIYLLRDGARHWIKDIATFTGEGYVWDDVSFVSCDYLRALPDGDPIPPDAGTPPQP